MIRNYFLLNLLLILIIAVLGNKFYHVLKYSAEIPIEAGTSEVRDEVVAVEHRGRAYDENAFEVISAMDLFRPSRTAPSVEKKATEKPPLPAPPKLFGTVILNENKTAILEASDSRTTKVYRLNDTVSGYTVVEIHEDKVVLLGNDEKVEVRLRENKGVQAPVRSIVRPPIVPQPGRQIQSPGTVQQPQRRARPVPPRRRPSRTVPQDNVNIAPPEIPHAPEMSESPEEGNEPVQEEDQ